MLFRSIVPSPKSSLSLHQILELTKIFLENAIKANDHDIVLVLCHHAEAALYQAKGTMTKASTSMDPEDQSLRQRIATAYFDIGKVLDDRGYRSEAQSFNKKCEKWGGLVHESGRTTTSSRPSSIVQSIKGALHSTADTPADNPSPRPSLDPHKQADDIAVIPLHIFPKNVRPPVIDFKPLEPDTRLNDTPQLAVCLSLLQTSHELDDIQDQAARNWLQTTQNDPDERERLKTLATDVIRAFKRDELKDAGAVTELVCLAPVLENDDFRYLVKEFYSGIDQSGLLDIHQLEGLAQLIQGADPGYLEADDLVKILELLSARLRDTHQQSPSHLYQLTLAVSHVLDAMADAQVKGLDREKLHEPLTSYLDELKGSTDTYLVYQAAYAYQALLCVPDNETIWHATLRRTGKVVKGVSGLVSAVKGLDLNGFVEGLKDIQQGMGGVSEVVQLIKNAYDDVSSLAENGQGFLDCLKEGLSFNRRCAWYPALRGADTLIRDGQLVEFRKLVCEAPCRRNPAFQWGVCQRLGELAGNPMWDADTRRGAIAFLGEIYRDDAEWGQQATVKQWILNILMQLSSGSGSEIQFTEALLQDLRKNGDVTKQKLYQTCREKGSGSHPLKVALPALGSPSLLDRVQERPDVEGNLRQLRRQRLKERGNVVYIPPQAKTNLQASDEARFALMEKVGEFLVSEQMVFLVLGDSGAGKSTFNRELECDLWQTYKKKTGAIPLYINLPAIDKPEHDMIAKQLRKVEFTEPQIRELKIHRKFILICDGYDESHQTHNLYSSNRLNQPGEWNAKMVISCRSEYNGVDYQDRFQPGDRNHQSEAALFQEAVITPFSLDQVQDYITQYVSIHRPLWEADVYKKALDLIPSLKDLVRNPFLMSLSLEVLPRMVDPGQDLSTTHITRVALYDQFVEHWLERGKKRLGEKNLSPQARAAFESLSDEGFRQNGIDYLKRLSSAIYKEQGGQPIVRYSRYKDENSWKAEFFSREEEKQLLREACPLIRSGNQHRFIHRSLLEYGLALAIFDPQDWKERTVQKSALARRGSTSSISSFVSYDTIEELSSTIEQGPDPNSPLVWRSFVTEPSVLQFLEERVQEPLFKQQLLDYIEQSKTDKKWRKAAANAITILVRAGVQFNGADLRGIQIPKADLSYGVFDSAQLQEADLREVNLCGVWLRQANLSRAKMTGVQFGELPLLQQDDKVVLSAYSPDGRTIAVGLENGQINVYLTSTWERLWTLSGHERGVVTVMYSPDGRQVASASKDSTVRLWDIETGFCNHILWGHNKEVTDVVYSPDGSQVASASVDTTVQLWDVESGKCRLTLTGHTKYVLSVGYSPKDNQIASSSADRIVRLWNIETGVCLHELRGHDDWVRSVTYSPQGDTIASGSNDTTIRLWDVATGNCRHILTGHSDHVFSITYSPQGNQLASGGRDNTIRLWDVETGGFYTLHGHSDHVKSVTYSPRGDLIASASEDKTVRLWDAETGVCRQTLTGHSDRVPNVAFSPKGDQVASSSPDMTVRLWDIGARTSRHVSSGHGAGVMMIKCSPNGDQFVSCSHDTTIRLWDVKTGECRHTLRGHTEAVCSALYSPQGYQIATGSYDNTVRLWDVATGSCSHILTGHIGYVNSIAYSPIRDQLASASNDQTMRLWDVNSGECQHTLTGHTDYVLSFMYSPDGNQIASSSGDGTVRLWDVETGICRHILEGHSDWVTSIVYSPQGDQIATASGDETVRLWDVSTGDCRHVLGEHGESVNMVMYSPQGEQILSCSLDGSMRLWDTETGACRHVLTGHTEMVNDAVFSPAGDLVVSASSDKTAGLWDVASGQCRAVIQVSQDRVNDVNWVQISDVPHLITGCQDGSVQMWRLIEDGDLRQVCLRWGSMSNALAVMEATIQDVQGLSPVNEQLLKQRGAIGEPVRRSREVSKRLISIASVVSELKSRSAIMEDYH